jgi:hypothetical protein
MSSFTDGIYLCNVNRESPDNVVNRQMFRCATKVAIV